MASITERNGRYLVRVRRDGYKLVAKTFTKKADAQVWGRRVEADMESGRWQESGAKVPTLREAVALYKAGIAGSLKGSATYAYWLDELASSFLADSPIDRLSATDLSAWRDAMASTLRPGTVARKLGLLSGLFTWAQKDRGWLPANPMHQVRKPRVNDARDRVITPDELRFIYEAARSSRAVWMADVLTILQTSAMRRGELWGLQRPSVDYSKATAYLSDTKNGCAREVPLCPAALAALRRLDQQAEARGDSGLIPVTSAHAISLAFRRTLERSRRMYQTACLKNEVRPAAEFLADLRLHDFRHHAVTAWASTGALSVIELMTISGHKTPRMLARYAHLSATTLASKMASLNP